MDSVCRGGPMRASRGKSALVLCGGGSFGALEVGFAKALYEAGHRPDIILGSSIGALNGAFLAGGATPVELERLWREFRLWKAVRPNWRWLSSPRVRPGFLDMSPLRRILRAALPSTRFEELGVPLSIVTTDIVSGLACYWEDTGDIIEPLLASMSLPGIFPPVGIGGSLHIDGGISDNTPLSRARRLGATRAFMIECACAEPCSRPPTGWTGIVGRAFEIALNRKHALDMDRNSRHLEIFRVVPRLKAEPSRLNFSGAGDMIALAYEQTSKAVACWAKQVTSSGNDIGLNGVNQGARGSTA